MHLCACNSGICGDQRLRERCFSQLLLLFSFSIQHLLLKPELISDQVVLQWVPGAAFLTPMVGVLSRCCTEIFFFFAALKFYMGDRDLNMDPCACAEGNC